MSLTFNPNFEFISTNNSSTANLAAGATFTGTADDIKDADVVHVVFFATQNCTLVLDQSPDGTNWDITDSFSYSASNGFSTSVTAVAQYYRIRVTNTGASSTTSLRLQSQYSSSIAAVPRSLGQKVSTQSFPVVLASDQSTLNVAVLSTPSPTPEASGFSFGQITLAAISEVLLRKATYTEQTSNAQRSIKSSNAADTAAGTGARTVLITYYTSTGTGPFTETLTLNGTTGVNTVATDICYIDDMTVLTAGSGGVPAGNITLQSTTAGGGVVIKQIIAGDLQAYDAVRYIATGKTLYITGLSAGHNGTTVGSGARYRLRKQTLNNSTALLTQCSDFVRLYGQSSTFARDYTSNIIVTGPAKVELWVLPETSSSTIYYGSFDYFTR